MDPASASHFLLLGAATSVLLEVVVHFTGPSPRAEKARARQESKPQNREPSYAAIYTDLKSLESTLQSIPVGWTPGETNEIEAIEEVLRVIESKFLTDSEDERDELDFDIDGLFPGMRFLLSQLQNPDWAPEDSNRIDWLCNKTKFEHPKRENREKLVASVGLCQIALRKYASASFVDISWLSSDTKQAEWAGARVLYSDAERFHAALSSCWDCDCGAPHRDSKFAFDLSSSHVEGSIGCTFYYPSSEHRKGPITWRPARVYYHEHEDPHNELLTPQTSRRSHHRGSSLSSRSASPFPPRPFICDFLEASHDGQCCLALTNGSVRSCEPEDEFDLALHQKTENSPISLTSWLEPAGSPNFASTKKKHRLTLALILCYSYLHLGGGPWWPYHREHNIYFFDKADMDARLVKLPFFSPSLDEQGEAIKAPFALRMLNAEMPSLPSFGKLLLALTVGHSVSWDDFDKVMEDYEEEMHAKELLGAVAACVGNAEDKTLTEGGNIRDNERLRLHFVKEVVLKVQYVLEVAYHLRVQDIFSMPETTRMIEVGGTSPARSPGRGRSPATVEGASEWQLVPDGFCLHDGHDMEELQLGDAENAAKWLSELRKCLQKAFWEGLAKGPTSDAQPVRVAVLDTGACISKQYMEEIYDDRLVECRSWLRSSNKEGELQFSVGKKVYSASEELDGDGHGTHATSVLLEATQDTDIEVYTAQVFGSRAEKVRHDSTIQAKTIDAISKASIPSLMTFLALTNHIQAIRYAVDVWQVDIISMSFGFPESEREIKLAIDHAYNNNVLMLAAASNSGGNNKPSWPAKYEHVMCIHATNGLGNKYAKNPTPSKRENNFAVLGSSVNALWPPQADGTQAQARVHKSGTSTATPIAAGIAGVIMSVLRRSRDAYLDGLPRKTRREEESKYEEKMEAVGRPAGMGNVFRLMVGEDDERRDGYAYVAPWRFFKQHANNTFVLATMLDKIEA